MIRQSMAMMMPAAMMGPDDPGHLGHELLVSFSPEMVAVELEVKQRQHHFLGRLVPFPWFGAAGFENDSVQQEQGLVFRGVARQFRQYGVIVPVHAGADFVEDFPEGINVRPGGARAFRRDKTLGAGLRLDHRPPP